MASAEAAKKKKADDKKMRENNKKRKQVEARRKEAAEARKRPKPTDEETDSDCDNVVGTGIYLEPRSSLKTGFSLTS